MASTFEEVAKLLPQERAERFLALVAQFKSVPDDDEYLQLLEAIGFMTLLWKEVPGEIKIILEGAKPVTETCHSVAKQISDAVTEEIPSHEDLTQVSQRLEGHEVALKRLLARTANNGCSSGTRFCGLLVSFVLGALVCFLGQEFLAAFFQW